MNIDRCCRVCLEEEITFSTFNLHEFIGTSTITSLILKICPNANLESKPDIICNDCLSELKSAVSFKQKCENSDSFLKNINLQIFKFDDDFIDTSLFDEDVQDYMNEDDLKPDFEGIFETNSKSHSSYYSVEKLNLVDSTPSVTAVKKKLSSKTIKCSMCEEEFSGPSKLIVHARVQHQDLKPFKCSDCARCYQNPKALKVHKRSHENDKRFKCSECSLEFHVKANLISHSRVHSGEKFHCSECRKSFSSLSYLRQHQLTHNENSSKQFFTCNVLNCGKIFQNSAAFRSHSQVHSERRFSCSHCESSFKTRQSLKVHLVKHSIGDAKSFQCHICGWTTIYRQQYYEHIKAHTAKRDLECFHCAKKFTKKSLLILHMQTHFSERNFACNIDGCQKKFKTYNSCYAHKRKHQNKNSTKKYNCANCDKVFTSHSVLISHVKAHTGESYTCHFEGCTRSYAHKQNLNMHLLTAHIQRETIFECELCQKTLSNSNALRVHLAKVHKSEKNIECPGCSIRFASTQLLIVHTKQFHQPKAFNCKFCNYSVNYKSDLDKHIARCHQQVDNENK